MILYDRLRHWIWYYRIKRKIKKKLETALLDAYEAIGGIDLAVMDGTRTYSDPTKDKGINTKILSVGRDAIAVEAIGAILVGVNPEKMPLIQEAVNRDLGEGDVEKIEVLGISIESLKENFRQQVA